MLRIKSMYTSYAITPTEHPEFKVNTGSGNGLVPSGNRPLPESMFTQVNAACGVTRSFGLALITSLYSWISPIIRWSFTIHPQ